MFPISAFFLSFSANYSVLQPHDKYLQLSKREVSLKGTWMRVKEKAIEFRQHRLNTLKKTPTTFKNNDDSQKQLFIT